MRVAESLNRQTGLNKTNSCKFSTALLDAVAGTVYQWHLLTLLEYSVKSATIGEKSQTKEDGD